MTNVPTDQDAADAADDFPHRCPPWCVADDVSEGGAAFHDSAPIRGDWYDGDLHDPMSGRGHFEVGAGMTTYPDASTDGHRRVQIRIDGAADHSITTNVYGARALASALLLVLDRVGEEWAR